MTGAGKLDQRVTFVRTERVPNGSGGYVTGPADVVTVWAQVWPVSGRERAEAGKEEAATMMRFKIRNRADVDDKMTIRWRNRMHNIRFIADAGSREPFLVIDAEAGVAL